MSRPSITATGPLTLATLRHLIDELCGLYPRPPSLAAVARVLRGYGLSSMPVGHVASLLATVAALTGGPHTLPDQSAGRPGLAAALTPRQLEDLLADMT